MIDIVIYYPYLDGTTTSLVDLWFNLNHYINVKCNIVVDTKNIKQNVKYFMQLKKSVPDNFEYNIIPLNKLYDYKFDQLIMSFGVFRFLDKIPNYNKLYLLDAGRIIYDYFVDNCKYIDYIWNLNNCTIYGNPANQYIMQKYLIPYHSQYLLQKYSLNSYLVKTNQIQYQNEITNQYIMQQNLFIKNTTNNHKEKFVIDSKNINIDNRYNIQNNLFQQNLFQQNLFKNTNNQIANIQNNLFIQKELDKRYKIYYHKFSHERFNHLKRLNCINGIVTEDKRERTGNIDFEYLKATELHYQRWRKVIDNVYAENIGKMIFEFSALDKKVYYSNENKTHNDGLTYYLKLFDIDDNISQEIHINEKRLFDILGMKDNDVLLKDILNDSIKSR